MATLNNKLASIMDGNHVMEPKPMLLTLARIDRTELDRQAFDDNRFRVTRTIATYIGEDGYEYGKAFEAHGVPVVPDSGTHAEINAQKVQYK